MIDTGHNEHPCRQKTAPLSNENGMTYLFVMMLVVFMSISLMGVTEQWSVIMKRDREAELLFRGNRIKEAIERYVADYEVQKATRPNRWPRTLKDLTKKTPRRYLQMAYLDPITGKEFKLIKIGEELHGVQSSSTDAPLNQVDFKGAKTYQAIRFESTGAGLNCQLNPLNPNAQANCGAPTGLLPSGGSLPSGMPVPQAPAQANFPSPSPSSPANPAPGP